MKITGIVHKYADHVDTDVIIPARYLSILDVKELAKKCMIDLDPEFANRVRPGDIIVAGKNFGCGSSREHAPAAIKAAGIACVVAETFARIFYRNAINIGLPIIECKEALLLAQAKEKVTIDFASGKLLNEITRKEYQAQSFPPFMQELIAAGGLIPYQNEKYK